MQNKSILIQSNADIEAENDRKRKEAEALQHTPVISSLASYVKERWLAAKDAKSDIEERLLECKRQRDGKYDPQVLAEIKAQGQSTIYIKLTDIKCRAVEAWLKSVYQDSGRPYKITPTPLPELPQPVEEAIAQGVYQEEIAFLEETGQALEPEKAEEAFEELTKQALVEMKEAANIAAEEFETEIDDDLLEGAWYKALNDVIYDIVTFPTGFIEGPVFRNKECQEWAEDEYNRSVPVITRKITAEFNRLSPFDVYPEAGAKSLEDGDLCIKYRYTRSQLNDMIGSPGYDGESIRLVLDQYDSESLTNQFNSDVESERADLENRGDDYRKKTNHIEAIKFIGSVPGKLLIEWGVPESEIEDPLREYKGICVLAGDHVISARLNGDPLGRKNVYGASFIKSNDSIWGTSVPEAMSDIQEVCNGCARAIVTNMSLASGPQVWLNASKLPPGTKVSTLHAWKIWPFHYDETDGGGVPMDFFQPKAIISELLNLYKYFFDQASEVTGIPTFIYGGETQGGAADTASGLSMLMNAASKVLQAVALNIDDGIIKPSVEAHWMHLMLNEPDKAQGDIKIIPRASGYLIQSEALDVRRQEFLDRTANDLDMGIIGIEGRAEILRKIAKRLKLEDNIIPKKEELMQNRQEQLVQAQVEEFVMNLSASTGLSPEQLMAMAQGQEQIPEQTETEPIQPDGAPMGGLQLMQ